VGGKEQIQSGRRQAGAKIENNVVDRELVQATEPAGLFAEPSDLRHAAGRVPRRDEAESRDGGCQRLERCRSLLGRLPVNDRGGLGRERHAEHGVKRRSGRVDIRDDHPSSELREYTPRLRARRLLPTPPRPPPMLMTCAAPLAGGRRDAEGVSSNIAGPSDRTPRGFRVKQFRGRRGEGEAKGEGRSLLWHAMVRT